MSGDGKSNAFDSRASGYGRDEGVATLVAKRLKDALAAGDPIRAVIRESLLNQDGKTETITTPSLEAQENLIRGCYRKAGLDPRDTQYFKAHGTGTQAGDIIEARAIATVFGSDREPLLIGSIKTNIAHTEAASGLASIIKTALAMEKGIIPSSIIFKKPNPKLGLGDWNLRLVKELKKWPVAPIRGASINNFGYGGTNAHIIIEESASWAPALAGNNGYSNGYLNGHSNGHSSELGTNGNYVGTDKHAKLSCDISKVLILSGKDEQACQKIISNLKHFLKENKSTQPDPGGFLESLVYTLGQRRTQFPWAAAHPVPVTEGIDAVIQLPSYPWNHQIKHWVEPRFDKALWERSQPPHNLLGSLVEGSNPERPSWRHILRISESPWTRDHVNQSNIVYPAAGYICLAIEAIRQLTTMEEKTGSKEISGYRLRAVDLLQALMIPDNSDGIEIQTKMRPVSDKDIGVRGWKHFEVWTVTADNRWIQHAKGLITIEFEGPSLGAVKPAMASRDVKGYTRRVIPTDLFANLRALGVVHGPMFQNMKSIVQSGSEMRSMGTMAVADTSVPNDLPRDNVLHPVTLDSIITAPYSAVPGAATRETAAKVPRSVQSFCISSKISHSPGYLFKNLFKTCSSLIRDGRQGMEADVSVSDYDNENVVLEMKAFSYQYLGRNIPFQRTNYGRKSCAARWIGRSIFPLCRRLPLPRSRSN